MKMQHVRNHHSHTSFTSKAKHFVEDRIDSRFT